MNSKAEKGKTVKLSYIAVVILTGGLGTRLNRVVSDRPKVLAQVLGRPFLTFLLDQIAYAGAREVVLCGGHMADKVREKLGDMYGTLSINYSVEDEPLGTGGALRLAMPQLKSEIVMVMNGDSYIDADLNAFLEWFVEKGSAAGLILTKVVDTSRFGRVMLAPDGRVERFKEKDGNSGPGWINAGIYLIKKKLVETIPSGKAYSLERDFFPGLIGKGLHGYRCTAQFLDIGTPESYSRADVFFEHICRMSGS